ncbi:MAG TPA: HNH endonuclease signature motif containing protein, partial [Polyangiaceae bacterium]
MRVVIGVTDNRWAAYLRDHADIAEVNFWQPSPHGFKALQEGEPFLFKTKDPRKFRHVEIPGYSLVGGGFFQEYFELRVSEAWAIWRRGNGTDTEQELLQLVQAYRAGRGYDFDPDPYIGCICLRNAFFAEHGDELPQPEHWSPNNVTIEGYEMTGPGRKADSEYVLQAFQLLQGAARIDFEWEPDLLSVDLSWGGPKFGDPLLVLPRVGQGRFRIAVDTAYDHQCAVTGSRTYPSLEAAHIRDYVDARGSHAISNALLLRSDVHRLYDRGYLGITPDLQLKVSPELRAHGWNGVEFYEKEAAGFRV